MLSAPTAPSLSSPLPDIQRLAWRRSENRAIAHTIPSPPDASIRLATYRFALPRDRPGGLSQVGRTWPCDRASATSGAATNLDGLRGSLSVDPASGHRLRKTPVAIGFRAMHPLITPRAKHWAARLNRYKALISQLLIAVLQEDGLMGSESHQVQNETALRQLVCFWWKAVDKNGDMCRNSFGWRQKKGLCRRHCPFFVMSLEFAPWQENARVIRFNRA